MRVLRSSKQIVLRNHQRLQTDQRIVSNKKYYVKLQEIDQDYNQKDRLYNFSTHLFNEEAICKREQNIIIPQKNEPKPPKKRKYIFKRKNLKQKKDLVQIQNIKLENLVAQEKAPPEIEEYFQMCHKNFMNKVSALQQSYFGLDNKQILQKIKKRIKKRMVSIYNTRTIRGGEKNGVKKLPEQIVQVLSINVFELIRKAGTIWDTQHNTIFYNWKNREQIKSIIQQGMTKIFKKTKDPKSILNVILNLLCVMYETQQTGLNHKIPQIAEQFKIIIEYVKQASIKALTALKNLFKVYQDFITQRIQNVEETADNIIKGGLTLLLQKDICKAFSQTYSRAFYKKAGISSARLLCYNMRPQYFQKSQLIHGMIKQLEIQVIKYSPVQRYLQSRRARITAFNTLNRRRNLRQRFSQQSEESQESQEPEEEQLQDFETILKKQQIQKVKIEQDFDQ